MSSRTGSSAVAPSSQNVWQRYIPRSPEPRNPSRSRNRSAAWTLASLAPSWRTAWRSSAWLANSVRKRPLGSLVA